MEVIIVLVFTSMVLVAGALLFLFARIRGGDFEHGDRLSLLPLEADEVPPAGGREGEDADGK